MPHPAKRPRDMSADELTDLRICDSRDPALQRATWFEEDDPMIFVDRDGCGWKLAQTADGEWVRTAAA